jgi:hypothetical protein
LFDTLTWAEILVKTTFLGTPTLTVLNAKKHVFIPMVEDLKWSVNGGGKGA